MASNQIQIKTQGFRAIEHADIVINGISVVAGENGSGKSTISKMLYYLFKTAANYDQLVKRNLFRKLANIERVLDIIHHEMFMMDKDRKRRDVFRSELADMKLQTGLSVSELRLRWLNFVSLTQTIYENSFSENNTDRIRSNANRLKFILRDLLKERDLKNIEEFQPFDHLTDVVDSLFKEAEGKITSRPKTLFHETVFSAFNSEELPNSFEVLEFDASIIAKNRSDISIPYSIQNAIYIDSPMLIGVEDSGNGHWDDLNNLLKLDSRKKVPTLVETIKSEIIKGEVSVEENPFGSDDYSFKRNDGQVYKLLDCATGIKSFAILQLLLKNGSLTDKTLLIIDEPESHLHPQWIIEYARLIVLINKEIGTKFFIASHNPDMVSAIKYISEKEGVDKDLNFYLAESPDGNHKYTYSHLGTEIEKIYGSFNIALDQINRYSL